MASSRTAKVFGIAYAVGVLVAFFLAPVVRKRTAGLVGAPR
jgi:hypothetical protein